MTAANVIRLEDHRKTGVAPPASAPESPTDARRAPWHYPPARPVVDWMPDPRPLDVRIDAGFRGLAWIAAGAAGVIVAGVVLSAIAGAMAIAVAGGA